MSRRWRLVLATVAFFAWLSYLGYAALSKNRGPVISRAQAAAATHAVVANVEVGNDGKPHPLVKVVEVLKGDDLRPEAELVVYGLTEARGFDGPGPYLLLLITDPRAGGAKHDPDQISYTIVGQQRSPGNDLSGVGPPLIYHWSDEVRKQFETLPK